MDDEPMWAADRVVASTPSPAITIPEIANEFAIKGLCVYVGYVRFDNQSIKRDRLIRIGFVLDFMKFISFTFGDEEMILVI
ncbi:hypothetical protein Tco_1273438 [Tanacetum coccineum]